MGITIIQKSDLNHPKPHPKLALVLAGGAVSGGAFKLGGLMALDRFMLNRRITNFDIYVGTSAGAIISTYIANGVPVQQVIASLEGRRSPADPFGGIRPGGTWQKQKNLDPMKASEFYDLNYGDFIKQPFQMIWDTAARISMGTFNFMLTNNIFRKRFRELLLKIISKPTPSNIGRFLKYVLMLDQHKPKKRSVPWGYIPTGIFTTDRVEQSTRRNIERNGLFNDFKALFEKRGRELYITATNLDTSERTIFGPGHMENVPISKAMQASIAIPLFYKPVRIDGVDYVDGAVAKTTSIDWSITKGADLVICYNPFRPFNHESFIRRYGEEQDRLQIADDGIYAVLNQVMRIVFHSRLMNGLKLRSLDPAYKGDLILIEPTEYDDKFFDMNPLAFWERRAAAKRGFESVKESIGAKYDILKQILNAYGIDTSPSFVKDAPSEPVPLLTSFYENIVI